MAKINLIVQLKRNNGSNIGSSINSGDKASFTEAKDAVAVIVQQRVDTASTDLADLQDAQGAFNS